MNEQRFSTGEAIRFGWETMKGNIGFFIVLIIVAGLIENVPGTIGNFARDFPLISFLLFFVGWLLGFVVQIGLIKVSLKFCDGIKGKLDDLLSGFNLLLSFIAASILYGLIVIGGTLLLIVPGVIWAIKFSLFPYFIVDKGMGPIEAIKASGNATTDEKLHLFLFGLALGGINILGALVFFVGLFATIPTSMVAYAYVYRTLAGDAEIPDEGPKQGPGDGSEPDMAKAPEESPKAGEKGVMYINLEG
ncbi:MAG: hypothetical protein KAJ10_12875 [Thermodesulfovibrionia bacterium]|nr:hypothetical protein [Thermodesulfovibrionia bacterium]